MSRQSLNSTHLVSFQPQVTEAGASGAKQFVYREVDRYQCRVVQGTSNEQMVATQREWESSYTVWTTFEPRWKNHDQLVILASPTPNLVGVKLQCRGKAVSGSNGRVWNTSFEAIEYRQQLTGPNSVPVAGQD